MTNSTLFCRKSELCWDSVIFEVIPMAFSLVILYFSFEREGGNIHVIIVASMVVWRSYFAHSFFQIHFMLFCSKLTFLVIHAPILDKLGLDQSLLV